MKFLEGNIFFVPNNVACLGAEVSFCGFFFLRHKQVSVTNISLISCYDNLKYKYCSQYL